MKIVVRDPPRGQAKALRAHAERRLQGALARYAIWIEHVLVRFSRQGRELACHIDVVLRRRQVIVQESSDDPQSALEHATERVARTVARVIERGRRAESGEAPPPLATPTR
jgi:ribosome-associated translation inhibitor RaiA